MIPTYELDDYQWNMLVQDVADNFGDVTLSRGFQYYKQGRVIKLTIPSERVVKATVEGNEIYQVEINLDLFTANRCNCPVSGACKHIFAAILKFADLHNRSVHTLVNAKTTAQLKPTPTKPASYASTYNQAKQLEAKKAAENEALLREQSQLIPTMSIMEWHELFELCTLKLTQSSRNTQFVHDALEAIFRIKPSLPTVIDQFYSLHAQLFVLSKLTKQPKDQSGYVYSYLAFHIHHAASDLQETIVQSLIQLTSLAEDEANSRLTNQTLTHLRTEMLVEANENHYFLSHYLSVWSHWICPTNSNELLFTDELQLLETTADESGSSLSPFACRLAQASMYLYQSDDQEAWNHLDAAQYKSDNAAGYLLFFLDYLSQNKQWTRLVAWLSKIAPLFNLRRNTNIRPYSEYWDLAVQHVPDAEQQMWDTLVSLLPHSRALYEEKLLVNGKWERWMDYHLSMDSDPLDFRVTELQPLEKNAPEVLLPFYHQAVERYVLLKNRDNYKSAVKLLKRLAKLYKKLKQEPRWELFLSSFISRNSRLRALQEELRKGKLVP
ncbi:SWIM zinc finger domain-containing protein [Cohnella sp. WQ 127256]|uniref:SWIM zinc finger family protein n=1 Tax=Cohnella sp. WQ 127256 TaxID=2938790 RepID=UPI0021185DFF|nr:hypothetical protein [Cohnella sp. WQ 127256]